MAISGELTVKGLRARPVSVPMSRPLQTAAGELTEAPLVLVDLATDGGVTGRSYVFAYTPLALRPVARLITELTDVIAGEPLAPVDLTATVAARFRMLGLKGPPTIALAAIDMAAWDALARAAEMPVCRLLGGSPRPIPAYGSLKAMRPDDARAEAAELAGHGFGEYKGRVGYAGLDDDRQVIRALREATDPAAGIAVDYNQALSVPEAIGRLTRLADEHLFWAEEPTSADDVPGHARIRREAPVPVQLGENWWGTREMAASIDAGASDLAMVDVMRIGGVTGWLRAAGLAEAAGIPLSSHLFVEVSAHLLAVSPTAHRLEYLDLASPVLAAPLTPVDGRVQAPDTPGFGLEWDEDAVERFGVTA